jgi:hypothetical protein
VQITSYREVRGVKGDASRNVFSGKIDFSFHKEHSLILKNQTLSKILFLRKGVTLIFLYAYVYNILQSIKGGVL